MAEIISIYIDLGIMNYLLSLGIVSAIVFINRELLRKVRFTTIHIVKSYKKRLLNKRITKKH